jgi:hypothetical protein
VLIEIVGGFLDRIEGDPIPPQGNFTLSAGKLDRRVSMVFVTIMIIWVKNMFCHVFSLIFSYTCFLLMEKIRNIFILCPTLA